MIQIKNLSKSYGEKIIFSNINLNIEESKCTVFFGQSGIGKTTLLRCIAGLEKPDGGTVEGMLNKTKTFVFQENRLIDGISVIDNILCVKNDVKRARYMLERIGLIEDENKKTAALSGGMKRRLAISRALAVGGDFYYLDEPLRELDSDTEKKVMQLIKEEIRGKTAVLITHDMLQAKFFGANVIQFTDSPMKIQQ